MKSGIDKAWETLLEMNPEDVERNAVAIHDKSSGCYTLRSLGMDFTICPDRRQIDAQAPEGKAIIAKFSYFSSHSFLWYLVGAKEKGLSGRLVRPEDLSGGQQFFAGTHELPLKGLAGKYGFDKDGFLKRAEALGGKPLQYGDASVELFPLPRIPVTLILWLGDDEFPARTQLLLDSSCEVHAALDIIWCAAMLSVLVML